MRQQRSPWTSLFRRRRQEASSASPEAFSDAAGTPVRPEDVERARRALFDARMDSGGSSSSSYTPSGSFREPGRGLAYRQTEGQIENLSRLQREGSLQRSISPDHPPLPPADFLARHLLGNAARELRFLAEEDANMRFEEEMKLAVRLLPTAADRLGLRRIALDCL